MNSAETPQHDPDTLCALRQLGRVAEIGMDILEGLGLQAKAPGADTMAHVHAFDRVSRALRLTILLRLRLNRDGLAAARATDVARREREVPENLIESVSERERIDRPERLERLDHERGDGFESLTVDQTLTAIQHGLGLAAPIDLTAQNDDAPVRDDAPAPDVAALARAVGRQRPPSRLSAAFDAQVRALRPTRPP